MGASAPSGLSEDYRQLMSLCLLSKGSQLASTLANIIAATEATAPKISVGMLAAVADAVLHIPESPGTHQAKDRAKQQGRQPKGSFQGKEAAADLMHQQESALLVLLMFARKTSTQLQTVLGLFFCQV